MAIGLGMGSAESLMCSDTSKSSGYKTGASMFVFPTFALKNGIAGHLSYSKVFQTLHLLQHMEKQTRKTA